MALLVLSFSFLVARPGVCSGHASRSDATQVLAYPPAPLPFPRLAILHRRHPSRFFLVSQPSLQPASLARMGPLPTAVFPRRSSEGRAFFLGAPFLLFLLLLS